MVYAEFAEQKGFASGDAIYNVFLLPYCHDAGDDRTILRIVEPATKAQTGPYMMRFLGTASGDWLDGSKPYHKIVGVQLDVKSVMRNYHRNENAQYALAETVSQLKIVESSLRHNRDKGLG